jgi:tetratricopeptide (TPR) repeat protein
VCCDLVILEPVVTVLTMSDSAAVDSVEAEALKEQGNVAYRNGDFQSALQLYSQAIDVDPQSSKYLVNRSLCHASLCNWSESLADAKKALTLEAKSQKAHYRAVKALFVLGRFKEARLAILNGLKECGESKEMRQLEDELMTRTGIPLRPKSTDFEIIGELGDGNFSKVYKAQHRATQKVYAIKVGAFALSACLYDCIRCSTVSPYFVVLQTIEKMTVDRMKKRHGNINNEILMEKRVSTVFSVVLQL